MTSLEEIVKEYNEWIGYLKNFDKMQYLPQFRQRLGEAVFGDPSHFVGQSSDILYAYLQPKALKTEEKLVGYVKTNLDSILAKIPPEKLLNIVLQVKPYKTGNEKHDKIAEQHQKLLEAAAFAETPVEVKREYIAKYIEETLKDKDFAPGAMYALQSPQYVQSMYELIVKVRREKFIKYFAKGKEINKAKLAEYLKANISASKEEEKAGIYVYLAQEAVRKEEAKKEKVQR